jgi:hypothetical protein
LKARHLWLGLALVCGMALADDTGTIDIPISRTQPRFQTQLSPSNVLSLAGDLLKNGHEIFLKVSYAFQR